MANFIEPIQKLIGKFTKLPSVGSKTAQRYAYSVLDMSEEEVKEFADALVEAKSKVKFCKICGNFSDDDICPICKTKDRRIICVVEDIKDIAAINKVKDYQGTFHVLGGTLSPINNIGPDKLNIRNLINRITSDEVSEIILATGTDVEGEATAAYLSKLIKPLGVKVTRIAHGIPIGSELEYTDEVTLSKALEERKTL